MRVWQVEGFRLVNYKSKKTGRQVEGMNIFVSSAPVDQNIEGREVKDIYLSSARSDYVPAVGDFVHIFYDERGFVDDIVLAK